MTGNVKMTKNTFSTDLEYNTRELFIGPFFPVTKYIITASLKIHFRMNSIISMENRANSSE